MNKFLNDIRSEINPISINRKIINTIVILFLGITLGTFSKFMDYRQAELPGVLMAIDGALDVHNFLGRHLQPMRWVVCSLVFFWGIWNVSQRPLSVFFSSPVSVAVSPLSPLFLTRHSVFSRRVIISPLCSMSPLPCLQVFSVWRQVFFLPNENRVP